MKRLMLRVLTVIAAGGITEARAADLGYVPRPYPPPPAPVYAVPPQPDCYSWIGPYIGGTLGYNWGSVSSTPTKPSGVFSGIQAGYNWQNGPWVFGVEGDMQVSNADDTFAPWKFSNPWFGTVRGRSGYTFSNVLIYATAGLAFGELRAETFGVSESHNSTGFAVGFGAEFGFAPNWSAKLEYLFIDLSSTPFAVTGVSNGYQADVFRAGVNYHF